MTWIALYKTNKNQGMTKEQAAESVVKAIGEALRHCHNDNQRRALRKEANKWLDKYNTNNFRGVCTRTEAKICL